MPGQYSSDSLWSYELGSKNTFFDHTLQIDASLFYIDWTNIQQNVYLPACGEQFTANLGKAKSEGGDLEVLYRPISALTFDLTAAYTDARLTKTSCAGSQSYDDATLSCISSAAGAVPSRPIATDGDALLGAPWSFTGSVEYHFPEWAGRTPYAAPRLSALDRPEVAAAGAGRQQRALRHHPTGTSGRSIICRLRAGLRFNGFDVSACTPTT